MKDSRSTCSRRVSAVHIGRILPVASLGGQPGACRRLSRWSYGSHGSPTLCLSWLSAVGPPPRDYLDCDDEWDLHLHSSPAWNREEKTGKQGLVAPLPYSVRIGNVSRYDCATLLSSWRSFRKVTGDERMTHRTRSSIYIRDCKRFIY